MLASLAVAVAAALTTAIPNGERRGSESLRSNGMVRVAVGWLEQRRTAMICRAHLPPLVAAAARTMAGKGGH